MQLAQRSGDLNAARADEPYRRAITGIYARLAATYQTFTGRAPPRPASVSGEPYPDAASLRADLQVLEQSLRSQSKMGLQRRRAPWLDCPGGGDLRLSSGDAGLAAKRRRARARGRRTAQGRGRVGQITRRSDEPAACRCCCAQNSPASGCWRVPMRATRAETAVRARHRARRGRSASALRPRLHHHLHRLQMRERVGSAGGQHPAQGGRTVSRHAASRAAAIMAVPLFETIGDLRAIVRRHDAPGSSCRKSRP